MIENQVFVICDKILFDVLVAIIPTANSLNPK